MNRSTSLFVLGSSMLLLLNGCGSSSHTMSQAMDTVEQLEGWEMSGKPGMSMTQAEDELSKAEETISAHLQSEPEDVDALLMSARVGRFQEMFEPVTLSAGQPMPSTGPRFDALQSNLDTVLTLQPDNAEACWLKSKLYGVRRPIIRDGAMTFKTVDLDRAIQWAQTSVEKQPDNLTYRESLAGWYACRGSFDNASQLMEHNPGPTHPFCTLLSDFENLPLPTEAVFLPEETMTFAKQQLERGRVTDHSQFRTRIYAVTMPKSELETFYSSYWPGFQMFAQKQSSLYTQFLTPAPRSSWTPASSADQVPTSNAWRPGVLMTVIEVSNPSPDRWRQISSGTTLGSTPPQVMCFVYFENCRPVN